MKYMATRSFITSDRWHGEIRVIPGRDVVDVESPLVRDPRGRWQPVDPELERCDAIRVQGVCTVAPAAVATEPLHTEPWRLLPAAQTALRSGAPSPVRVKVNGEVLRDILAYFRDDPEVERGVIGFGHATSRLVEAWHFEPAVGVGTRNSFRMDPESAFDVVSRLRRDRHLEPVMLAHSHPGGSGAASREDVDCWASWLDVNPELPAMLGLIAVRLRDHRSTVVGHVARTSASGQVVCEPVRLALPS